MCSYLFGTVSSPACASYALKQTAKDHKSEFHVTTIDIANDCFYVDDCLASPSTAEEAKRLLPELCLLLNKGGFQLTKWMSNDRDVLKAIPVEEYSKKLRRFILPMIHFLKNELLV